MMDSQETCRFLANQIIKAANDLDEPHRRTISLEFPRFYDVHQHMLVDDRGVVRWRYLSEHLPEWVVMWLDGHAPFTVELDCDGAPSLAVNRIMGRVERSQNRADEDADGERSSPSREYLEGVVRRAYSMAIGLDCEYTQEIDDLVCLLGDAVRSVDGAMVEIRKDSDGPEGS